MFGLDGTLFSGEVDPSLRGYGLLSFKCEWIWVSQNYSLNLLLGCIRLFFEIGEFSYMLIGVPI